jgi:hypothetical protein
MLSKLTYPPLTTNGISVPFERFEEIRVAFNAAIDIINNLTLNIMDTRILSKSNIPETGNISRMGTVTRANGYIDTDGFYIKIETTAGNLKVVLFNDPMTDGATSPIITSFQLGWNPELVKQIVIDEVNNSAVGISWGK